MKRANRCEKYSWRRWRKKKTKHVNMILDKGQEQFESSSF